MHGFLLGKFMPPTLGHKFLVDFAAAHCDRLTVLVCTRAAQPIPGSLRFRWMREAFPDARVLHHTAEIWDAPRHAHDAGFWQTWHDSIRAHVPEPIDQVFASEPYGLELAERLGARFIPVDVARAVVPVSATAVRADPMAHWDLILPQAQPHYLKRVCVFGPESTGKSTLAYDLARHFRTRHVPEYARTFTDHQKGRCSFEEISRIARGQMAAEDALARQARRVLVCDTDLITTTIWSDQLFGACPDWIREEAERRRYDLYLLCDVDAPWIDDGTRFYGAPAVRRAFFDHCRHELERRQRPYIVIQGTWEQRLAAAVVAVAPLVAGEVCPHGLRRQSALPASRPPRRLWDPHG